MLTLVNCTYGGITYKIWLRLNLLLNPLLNIKAVRNILVIFQEVGAYNLLFWVKKDTTNERIDIDLRLSNNTFVCCDYRVQFSCTNYRSTLNIPRIFNRCWMICPLYIRFVNTRPYIKFVKRYFLNSPKPKKYRWIWK